MIARRRKFQKDLNAGLVALVLLGVLERSTEDLYGYEIAKRLQRANEGEALFKEGTIYPVLRALAAAGPAHQPRRALLRRAAAPLLPHHRRGPRDARASGVPSGARRAASSTVSSKELTHERSPLDR